MKNENDILRAISEKYNDQYVYKVNLPEVFCKDKSRVKAIILGCDPTAEEVIPGIELNMQEVILIQ